MHTSLIILPLMPLRFLWDMEIVNDVDRRQIESVTLHHALADICFQVAT